MISTDDRSLSGRDGTTRLTNINNNDGEISSYYQYVPSPATTTSPILITSPSSSLDNQVVLRDHPLDSSPVEQQRSTGVVLNSSPAQNSITDFITHHLSSRLIPKLGSIVKRFSLNYSGEGLVTDRQRTRTVRVGIRFQVQVDSFVNNRPQENRSRAIVRTHSVPSVEQLDSGFSSPTDIFPNNRQLALEYSKHSGSSSSLSGAPHCCGDSSEGPSEAGSPILSRRQSCGTLAFHNRINQALNLLSKSGSAAAGTHPSSDSLLNRRRSVQVYRRGSATPERTTSIPQDSNQSPQPTMEDSSSYQVLRHFPGSNVNSLSELSWETAAFEKEIRDRIQWIGNKVSSIRIPLVVSQLMDFGREYAKENPVTALILLALCLTSSAPVFIFLMFAVTTILVTFLGFLFVEGTLLTAATVIFGAVILLVGFITLTAVLIGMFGYFTTSQAYMVLTGRSSIFKLLRKIPLIGKLFSEKSETTESTETDQLSKPSDGLVANGKVGNGYGPLHGIHSGGHHHDYDDDFLDSEDDDIEDDIEVENIHETDSDLGDNDEDVGNQEYYAAGMNKADNSNAAESHSDAGPAESRPMVNGHSGETDESENSENLAQFD